MTTTPKKVREVARRMTSTPRECSPQNGAEASSAPVSIQAAIAAVDATLAEAARLAETDLAGFQKLPKHEKEAFLAQARGQATPEGQTGALRQCPPSLIVRSPFNRDTFNPEKLAKLVDDVKRDGIIQPLIVRANPNRKNFEDAPWELIAGERRWRAATLGKLTSVPIIVRVANDTQAIELQFIENDDREDLNAIDEARKFVQLRERYEADGMERPVAMEKLGKIAHRSVSTIYARIALLELPEEAKEACESGKLPASHAALLTKVNDPGAQAKLVKQMLNPEPDYHRGRSVRPEVMAFDDAKLIAEQTARELEEEKAWQKQSAKYASKGYKVLTLKQGDGVIQWGRLKAGYVAVDAPCELDPKKRNWDELLGKHAPQKIVAKGGGDKVYTIFTRKAAEKALKEAGHKFAQVSSADLAAQKQRDAEAERRREEERAARKRVVDGEKIAKIVAAAEGRELNAEILRMLANEFVLSTNTRPLLERRGIKVGDTWDAKQKASKKLIDGADGKTLRGLIVESLMWDHNTADVSAIKSAAHHLGVKL